jgi:hypothetical protein
MDDCWTKALLLLLGYVLADALGLLVWALNRWVIAALAVVVHFYTISIATGGHLLGAVLTMFTPGPAQIYWVGYEWSKSGTFWHPLSYMCAALLVSLAIEFTGRWTYRKEIAEIQTRNKA